MDKDDWLVVLVITIFVALTISIGIYQDNAKVWCAEENKRAVTGVFIHTCIDPNSDLR